MPTTIDHVKDLIRTLAASGGLIRGELALGVAWICHATEIDEPGQWGNAYFRCPDPDCGQARDCDGNEDWAIYGVAICECGRELRIDDLLISEGWAERL